MWSVPWSADNLNRYFPDGTQNVQKATFWMTQTLRLFIEVVKCRLTIPESATAQPGQEKAGSDTLSAWFYRETVAGNVLHAVRNAHKDTEDRTMRLIMNILPIPRAHGRTSPSQVNR